MSGAAADGDCLSNTLPGAMRWYGWGTESSTFVATDRPRLWPFLTAHLGVIPSQQPQRPVDRGDVVLPQARLDADFLDWLQHRFPPRSWSIAAEDRLRHACGRSTSDIWR